jgi:hypothetical protein
MPKGPTRNVERYKTENTNFDEFEFQKNQAQITEQEHESESGEQRHGAGSGQLIPGITPQAQARRIKQVTKKAHQLVKDRSKKQQNPAKPAKGPAGKSRKIGSKKPALKTTAKKSATKKASQKKTAKPAVKKAMRRKL